MIMCGHPIHHWRITYTTDTQCTLITEFNQYQLASSKLWLPRPQSEGETPYKYTKTSKVCYKATYYVTFIIMHDSCKYALVFPYLNTLGPGVHKCSPLVPLHALSMNIHFGTMIVLPVVLLTPYTFRSIYASWPTPWCPSHNYCLPP